MSSVSRLQDNNRFEVANNEPKKITLDIVNIMCYNKGTVKGTATANPSGQGHSDHLNNSQSHSKGLTATPIILLKEALLMASHKLRIQA